MGFIVMEFLGDYSLESQVNWNKTFPRLGGAVDAAVKAYGKSEHADASDYHVIVTKDDPDGMGEVLFVIQNGKHLTDKSEIESFLDSVLSD